MTIDEMKKALECHAKKKYCCEECPINTDDDCSIDLARTALDFINRQGETLDKRQMALKTVMMALDKGGYSVTVTPDGEVRMMSWDSTLWISMRDEQPDHDGKYLVFNGLLEGWFKGENPDMMIGIFSWYKVKGGWYSLTFEKPITTVTHWMELPTAPEGWD